MSQQQSQARGPRSQMPVYDFGDASMVRVDRISRMHVNSEGHLVFYVLGSPIKHIQPNGAITHYDNILAMVRGLPV